MRHPQTPHLRPADQAGRRTTPLTTATEALLLSAALGGLLAGCGGGDDDDNGPVPFVLAATSHSTAAARGLIGDRDLLAYFADEATTGPGGTDLNGDGNLIDSVAFVIDTDNGATRSTMTAARAMRFLNGVLFLEVDEAADGRDWNSDMDMSDSVLLAYLFGAALPVYVDDLSSGTGASMVVGDKLVYDNDVTPTAEFETNLSFVTVASRGAAPSAPMGIVSTIDDLNDDGVAFELAAAHGDVLLLTADENTEGRLNGDMDATDSMVLAALDAGEAVPTVTGVGLALSDDDSTDAVARGADWLVAFLVDEAAEGANLNDPMLFAGSWQPAACVGRDDVDQLDHVLHWFLMNDLVATATTVNTGLVGTSGDRVAAHPQGFVAVVSNEADEGAGGCNLNGDADGTPNDDIFRWVEATNPMAPVTPVTASGRLLAVDDDLPGGSGGFALTATLFALAVDEAADGRDHDGESGTDRILVAAHNPANAGQGWNFNHGGGSLPIGVTWMADDERSSSRFLAAITEDAPGSVDRNGDGDRLDSSPTFPAPTSANILGFPGVGIAVDQDNAGISTADGYAFYRVSEAEDGGRDRNGDGDTNDEVLQRVKLDGTQAPFFMGSMNDLVRPAFDAGLDGTQFGAILYQESQFGPGGNDLNNDGDTNDLVVRWFRTP